METKRLYSAFLITLLPLLASGSQVLNQNTILLRDNWSIQSSVKVKATGKEISVVSWQQEKWYPASVPSTVLGTLVENKVFPDPYFGTNLQSLPGYFPRRGDPMPDNSPFKPSWWYRTIFTLPQDFKAGNTWIRFHSINYKANIWLNGQLVADTAEIQGAYRLYNLEVTNFALPGEKNCLALEIFPPKGNDLTITWVDWNPTPPDKNTGIWYDVSVYSTGGVALENPFVKTKLNLPSTDTARLTISADLTNLTDREIKGIVKGTIEKITFSRKINLKPKESKHVTFTPEEFSQLIIRNPRLWWPYTAGPQNLYDLNLSFEVGKKISDSEKVRFGIREISSWMNVFDGKRTRVFQVNGKNVLVRGGGYVEDMMLRPSEKRVDDDIRYAKHIGINALRMEAPRGPDYLFRRCDEEGILLMVGWCCCSSWEQWKEWTPGMKITAQESWRDQIVRLRNHPSVFDWLYGSDNFPPADVEKMYIQVLNDFDGTRPYQSSATRDSSTIAGFTGLWMGPYPKVYSFMPPNYWYGKLEFNTEAGPSGEQISPVETMRKMMPENDLWPISNSWNIRLNKAFYPDMRNALFSRYGKPAGVEEYSMKSQVLQYEATRAMFEAFAANKYRSSGIIYWMYNSAWPSLYWQFYDYFFAPNGSFYGARNACEPLHIQYSYIDSSICIVNGQYKDFSGLKASVKVYDRNMDEKFSKEIVTGINADESRKIFKAEWPDDSGDLFFLKLRLTDFSGTEISSGFYWLSGKGDENADFSGLNALPKVLLRWSVSTFSCENGKCSCVLEVENPSTSLAFAVNPKIIGKDSKDLVLPVFWEDNYFSLLAGEKRSLTVEFYPDRLHGEKPVLALDGWNIVYAEKELR
jgi:exo-1,4-beta-D-glucosaminidase